MQPQSTLIATLGSEPQVVTAALDLLLDQNAPIHRVWILHTSALDGPIPRAVETLKRDFDLRRYPDSMLVEYFPILNEQNYPVLDIESPDASEAAFRTLYRLLHHAKTDGDQVHLCISGGRKNLAMFGMVAAQLLFDDHDYLWHLYSGGEFLASKRLHPQPGDEARLLSIPVLLRDYLSPALTHLKAIDDPFQALERIRQMDLRQKLEQAASFVNGVLTAGERRVVSLLVREGLSDQEIADRLVISPRTVEQHLRSSYEKAVAHWELQDISRSQLIVLLHTYYNLPGG